MHYTFASQEAQSNGTISTYSGMKPLPRYVIGLAGASRFYQWQRRTFKFDILRFCNPLCIAKASIIEYYGFHTLSPVSTIIASRFQCNVVHMIIESRKILLDVLEYKHNSQSIGKMLLDIRTTKP
jgi:hypothetical protein